MWCISITNTSFLILIHFQQWRHFTVFQFTISFVAASSFLTETWTSSWMRSRRENHFTFTQVGAHPPRQCTWGIWFHSFLPSKLSFSSIIHFHQVNFHSHLILLKYISITIHRQQFLKVWVGADVIVKYWTEWKIRAGSISRS